MKFPTEIEIGGKIRKIPQSWDDINLRQYLRIYSSPKFDDIEFLSVMLDCSQEEVKRATITDLDMIVYPQLEWYLSEDIEKVAQKLTSGKRPKTIKINNKDVAVPYDIQMKEFGQKISAEQSLNKHKDNPLLAMPEIMAIYLYPEYSGELYDYDKAMLFCEEFIVALPLMDAYPVGRFFLMTLRESLSKKMLIWLENIPQKRRGQVLKNLKNSSKLKH